MACRARSPRCLVGHRQADDLLHQIDRGYSHISDRPTAWPSYAEKYRHYILDRFPYAIIYHELPDCIDINNERLGYFKTGVLDELANLKEPEISNICRKWPNLPKNFA